MLALEGPITRETRVAGLTVSAVDAETLPYVAVIVSEPAETEEAKPLDPPALLIVAMPVLDDPHCTAAVKSWVLLSE